MHVPNGTSHAGALFFACLILCSAAGCWGDDASLNCWVNTHWDGFQFCQQLSPTMLMYWKVGGSKVAGGSTKPGPRPAGSRAGL